MSVLTVNKLLFCCFQGERYDFNIDPLMMSQSAQIPHRQTYKLVKTPPADDLFPIRAAAVFCRTFSLHQLIGSLNYTTRCSKVLPSDGISETGAIVSFVTSALLQSIRSSKTFPVS